MNMNELTLKQVPINNKYFVSPEGKVYHRDKHGKLIEKHQSDMFGFKFVWILNEATHKQETHLVHRLVGELYLSMEKDWRVVHIDGDKTNNSVNNLSFLKNHGDTMRRVWQTNPAMKTNVLARIKKIRRERNNRRSVLTKQDVVDIRYLHTLGFTYVHIGSLYGLHAQNVSKLCRRITWRNVP